MLGSSPCVCVDAPNDAGKILEYPMDTLKVRLQIQQLCTCRAHCALPAFPLERATAEVAALAVFLSALLPRNWVPTVVVDSLPSAVFGAVGLLREDGEAGGRRRAVSRHVAAASRHHD